MKKIITPILLVFCIINGFLLFAQTGQNEIGGEYPIGKNDANNPCITSEQYKNIEKRISENCKLLGIKKGEHQNTTTTFSWPLQTANGFNECSYYVTYNYVDQDTTVGNIKDWNCGSATYDGHRGNDLALEPYPFYMMDNNQIEVIAAAPGTIVDRADGNFDKNCAMNNSTANYVIIQHADGSVALYWHMKKNTVTAKTVGQTVALGEYLGYVGSSGSSTAPHLHFEVWSGITSNTLQDAYSGPCNTLNANSWWVVQKPYTEPAVIHASVHSALPVFPACPGTETPNEDSCFAGGSSAKFYIFIRDETASLVANERIVNPDGSTFTSWVHNSNTNYKSSYWYFTKTLPSVAGSYTFEVTYNNIVCNKEFKINCVTGIADINNSSADVTVFPNPSLGKFNLTMSQFENSQIKIYNLVGECIYQKICTSANQQIDLSSHKRGIYFLRLKTSEGIVTKKLIIQ